MATRPRKVRFCSTLFDIQLLDALLNVTHSHSQDPIGLLRKVTGFAP